MKKNINTSILFIFLFCMSACVTHENIYVGSNTNSTIFVNNNYYGMTNQVVRFNNSLFPKRKDFNNKRICQIDVDNSGVKQTCYIRKKELFFGYFFSTVWVAATPFTMGVSLLGMVFTPVKTHNFVDRNGRKIENFAITTAEGSRQNNNTLVFIANFSVKPPPPVYTPPAIYTPPATTYQAPKNENTSYYTNDRAQTIISMEKQGGIYIVPCKVNNLPLKFIFDTGASDVSISLTEAVFMLKNGYLSENDILGREYYSIANGDIVEGTKINIKEIEFAGLKLYNVEASISHQLSAPLLLGQSVISRLGKITIDPSNNTLTINNK